MGRPTVMLVRGTWHGAWCGLAVRDRPTQRGIASIAPCHQGWASGSSNLGPTNEPGPIVALEIEASVDPVLTVSSVGRLSVAAWEYRLRASVPDGPVTLRPAHPTAAAGRRGQPRPWWRPRLAGKTSAIFRWVSECSEG